VLANRGVTIEGKGGTIARALNHYGGAESLREAPKSQKNVTSAFYNTIHLLPKDLRFEHVGARVVARMSQQGGIKNYKGGTLLHTMLDVCSNRDEKVACDM